MPRIRSLGAAALFAGALALAPGAVVIAPLQAQTPSPAQGAPDAKPNSALLVARPSLLDPNFRETVVLVTQAPDASTIGVILNRPTSLALSDFVPPSLPVENYRAPLFEGGPVLRRAIVAVFDSDAQPPAAAFRILERLWLTMHPRNIERLLDDPSRRYRLYAGFSGWAPRQLEGELFRKGWYVLPADPALVFREDTSGMWRELVLRARGREAAGPAPGLARGPENDPENESPAGAGL